MILETVPLQTFRIDGELLLLSQKLQNRKIGTLSTTFVLKKVNILI
jgi:hypothetical protein